MTVQELIDKLYKIEDKSKLVWVYSYDDWAACGCVEEDSDGTVLIF